MTAESITALLAPVVLIAPAALLAVQGLAALLSRPLSEKRSALVTQAAVIAGLTAAIGVLVLMLVGGSRHVGVELGNWVALPDDEFGAHFVFHLHFAFDRLSVPFTILSFLLVGTIGAFAHRYLHRERGYNRFFLLYAVFLLGMVTAVLADTIETLFLGWELVGLSSALLVAFFHDRPAPVNNGQRVWAIYRFADAAFLMAAVALHHVTGAGDFATLTGQGPWPYGVATMAPDNALFIGLLLVGAAAGKSALVPFSGWLPRAMEGPTPSSAVFYGALSVHLGVYLLLRVSPILALSPLLSWTVVALGLTTAVYAAVVSRVQSDVKTMLAFASLTQVGIITVEIGLGFRYLALVHMIGHACLRTLQLLRTPSLLQDRSQIENAIGARLEADRGPLLRLPPATGRALYRFAIRRGSLDAVLDTFVAAPFVATFAWCKHREEAWVAWLAGERPRRASEQSSDERGAA